MPCSYNIVIESTNSMLSQHPGCLLQAVCPYLFLTGRSRDGRVTPGYTSDTPSPILSINTRVSIRDAVKQNASSLTLLSSNNVRWNASHHPSAIARRLYCQFAAGVGDGRVGLNGCC